MAESPEVISHWHYRAEDFSASALEFYSAVRTELESIRVPVSFGEIEWSEGGILSAKRSYLRIEFNRFVFDICAAPFGTSFFFSWWLARRPGNPILGCLGIMTCPLVWLICVSAAGAIKGTLLAFIVLGVALLLIRQSIGPGAAEIGEGLASLPYIGPVIGRFINPLTYYAIDTRIMFEETVHETVLKIVDGLLAAKGAKSLTAADRKPKPNAP